MKQLPAPFRDYMLHKYGVCLVLILTSVIVQIAAPDSQVAHVLIVLLYGLTLLSAMTAADSPKSLYRLARIVVLFLVLASAGLSFGGQEIGDHATRISTLILILVAPVVIIRGLIRHGIEEGVVTVQTMFGVLCLYLLLGLAFASAYNVIANLDSSSFWESGEETTSNFLFFSFSTMTTTGYGNLIPAGGMGRALATLESILGQVYLVTVVAAIVGNLGRKTVARRSPEKTRQRRSKSR